MGLLGTKFFSLFLFFTLNLINDIAHHYLTTLCLFLSEQVKNFLGSGLGEFFKINSLSQVTPLWAITERITVNKPT